MKGNLVFLFLVLIYNIFFILTGYFGWPIQFCFNLLFSFNLFYYYRNRSFLAKLLFFITPIYYFYLMIDEKLFNVLPIALAPFFIFFISLAFKKSTIKVWKVAVLGVFLGLVSYPLMQVYLSYYFSISNTSKIGDNLPYFNIVDNNGIKTDSILFKPEKIFVIDIWSSNCGFCFEKMNEFSELQDYYSDANLKFFTLNLPLQKDNLKHSKNVLSRYYYKNNNLFATDTSTWSIIGVNSVPKYLIVKNGKIKYFGNIQIENKIFENDLYDEIDNVLKN